MTDSSKNSMLTDSPPIDGVASTSKDSSIPLQPSSSIENDGVVGEQTRTPTSNDENDENETSPSSSSSSSPSQQQAQQQTQQPQLPVELQLYEIDLTNPDLDPLEFYFRKYVPIPRTYYWDTASETNSHHANLPLRVKLWHTSIYYLGEVLKKAEAGGEMIANVLGLNEGPFDYVTNNMTEEEMERSRANVEERRRRDEGVV
mmetsp:Transcript_4649/g.10269  ORF Transcript_4649/g.10269 Transcript_4649/m.10269 type:complete len:202 (-) Transcript_4649:98-703(-)